MHIELFWINIQLDHRACERKRTKKSIYYHKHIWRRFMDVLVRTYSIAPACIAQIYSIFTYIRPRLKKNSQRGVLNVQICRIFILRMSFFFVKKPSLCRKKCEFFGLSCSIYLYSFKHKPFFHYKYVLAMKKKQ